MTTVYNLKNGVNIADLYKDLDAAQIKKIEKAATDGFTVAELKSLEEDGIDVSLIKNNSTKDTDTKKTTTKKQSKADVKTAIDKMKRKYCQNLGKNKGDPYSASNPQLIALNKMLDDGYMAELAKDGFTKTQILEIIAGAFPTVGIAPSGEDGAYTRPHGHGAEAQKIYDRFSSQLMVATSGDTEEIKAAKAELAKINNQIATNNHNMQILEVTIEALQEEVEQQINDAIEESKDIQEENKKKAQEAVSKRISEYSNSNGEMTYEEFQQKISSDLDGVQTKSNRALGDVVNDLLDANHKMSLLKGYVADLGDLAKNNEDLTKQAQETKEKIDDLVEEQIKNAEGGDPQAKCCDPIGFSTDAARYDFFVDNDNNGDITNENEFLGSKDGFSEMKALDTDGDGLVTASELDNANVKVIKTNKDGTQEIVKASEVFTNETDGINLNSYKGTNQDIGNGNTLLGTFNATLNGQKMEGYQTLDDLNWLDKNYEFTDEVEGKGRFAQDVTDITKAIDMKDKINLFTVKNEELDTKLKEAWNAWGFTDEMASQLINASEAQAKRDGTKIENNFEEIARKEEELATQSQAEKDADKTKLEEILKDEVEEEIEEEKEEEKEDEE